MNMQITRNLNISGCGMPMMPAMGMGGYCSPMLGGSIFCRPYPMMAMGGAMAAGICAGALLANPQILSTIGSGLKWGYNNLILPLWNSVLKPAGLWAYNNILKPIGSGLKWLWDHTLGWVIKKVESKKAAKETAKSEKAE